MRSWIKSYFREHPKQMLAILGLGLITYICAVALMFTSGFLISRTAEAGCTLFMIMVPVAFVQVFGIGKPAAQYFERLTAHDWVFRITSSLRVRLYSALERTATQPRLRTGVVLGLLAEDIGHLQNLFIRVIFPTIICILLYVLLVIVLGFASVPFALTMALMLGVTVFVLPAIAVQVNRAAQLNAKKQTSLLYDTLTDNVLGAADWVLSGRGQQFVAEHTQQQEALLHTQAGLRTRQRALDFASAVVFVAGACVTLWWAAGAFGGQAAGGTANWIAAFVVGFFPLIEAFAPLTGTWPQAIAHATSVKNLQAVEEVHAPSNAAEVDFSVAADASLTCTNATFAYPGAAPTLQSINLQVPAGQKLAILGRSGGGKSTLLSLLRGDLTPTQGEITVTCGSQTALTSALGTNAHHVFGVVQQQPYLFNRTLRENLSLGAPDATDETLWEALENVGLAAHVRNLPQGLDTIVSEGGRNFSGGQAHRIALARVLLTGAPIILLDEPFVSLDPTTEQALLETLFDAFADRTIIMVTHHLAGINKFDRIVFVNDAHITEEGTPDNLAATSPHFHTLLAFDN